jgi:ATP synthase F1 complex assembly factor 1
MWLRSRNETRRALSTIGNRVPFKNLVKDLDRFKALNQTEVETLWGEFHETLSTSVTGKTLGSTDYAKIKQRGLNSPRFVLPNVRSKTSFFVLLTEYKDDFVLLTFLDDYRRLGEHADPWCSISFYPELEQFSLVQTLYG